MLVLFETPAGFALFKVGNDKKLSNVDNIYKEFQNAEKAQNLVSLQAFHKFSSTTDALAAATALNESKMDKSLKTFLKKSIVKKKISDKLGVIDSKLGGVIKEKLGIECISGNVVNELTRGLRNQLSSLLSEINEGDFKSMVLGLSHSLSRYKIKFSPDKVDTMIIQAIGLLDDLEKELNTYSMRVKEWYGWHFPELAKIISDNVLFAKVVKTLGIRSSNPADLSDILPEELESQVKEAIQISMGTEISEDDIFSIRSLCIQVIEMSEYKDQLYQYLTNRMQAIAPNLTQLVGELVGARLISHAGSLLSLAKYPASTVQILGAEKALFRALKTKHATPKYGLIYHASLVGQASTKNKGKMSRVLANKCALSIRVDALGDADTSMIGGDARGYVEGVLSQLEGRAIQSSVKSNKKKNAANIPKYDQSRDSENPAVLKDTKVYNTSTDSTLSRSKDVKMEEESPRKKEKKEKKKEKKAKKEESPRKKDKKEKKKEKKEESPRKKEKKDKKKRKRDSEGDNSTPKKKKKSADDETDF